MAALDPHHRHIPRTWDVQRLRQARVMVVGAGALGNEVLKNLALLGVGELFIVDFDVVEAGNLGKSILFREADIGRPKAEVAAEAVLAISPGTKVWTVQDDFIYGLGLGLLDRMDVVFGCVDNRLTRLWINRYQFWLGKAWVSGGILNQSGQVVVYAPGLACYECGLTKKGWEEIRQRMGCADIVQRFQQAGIQPATPLAASIIGAVQVQEGLQLFFGKSGLEGKMWSFEGEHLWAQVYELKAPEGFCDSHFQFGNVFEESRLHHELSVKEALAVLEDRFGKGAKIRLRHSFALEVADLQTGQFVGISAPVARLAEWVPGYDAGAQGGSLGIPPGALVTDLGGEFPKSELKLWEVGILPLDLVQVLSGGKNYYLELTGDAGRLSAAGGQWEAGYRTRVGGGF